MKFTFYRHVVHSAPVAKLIHTPIVPAVSVIKTHPIVHGMCNVYTCWPFHFDSTSSPNIVYVRACACVDKQTPTYIYWCELLIKIQVQQTTLLWRWRRRRRNSCGFSIFISIYSHILTIFSSIYIAAPLVHTVHTPVVHAAHPILTHGHPVLVH